MKLLIVLQRFFNIKPGEGMPTLLLSIHSFFMGIFLSLYFTPANAVFISTFDVKMLPYAYIVSGVVGYGTAYAFSQLQKRTTFARALLTNLGFILVLLILFRVGHDYVDQKWLAFIMFVWIVPIYAQVYLGFWGMASKLFNLRQGKRLLGLASSGDTIAQIFSYFSVPLLLKVTPAENLLWISIAALILCIASMWLIFRRYQDQITSFKPPAVKAGTQKKPVTALFRNRYFMLMAILTLLNMLAYYFADYVFIGVARLRFTDKQQLTQFIGIFFGAVKFLEFILKTFFAGRLINQNGLRFALTILPLILTVFAIIAALSGTLAGSTGLVFFLFISFIKLNERVVRRAIDEPSFKILYQPLPQEERFICQTQVEGVIKQLSNGPAGLILIGLNLTGDLRLLICTYLFIGVAVCWLFVARLLYREYQNKLKSNLSRIASRGGQTVNPLEAFHQKLRKSGPDEVMTSLSLLEKVEPQLVEALMLDLLPGADNAVTVDILKRTDRMKMVTALPVIRQIAPRLTDPVLQGLAAQTIRTLEETQQKVRNPAIVLQMARSTQPDEREFAARIIGANYQAEYQQALFELLYDANSQVCQQAVRAAGRIRDNIFWQRLIELLSSAPVCNAAMAALAAIGEPIVERLEEAFDTFERPIAAKLRILRLYGQIGGEKARTYLLAKINYPHKEVRTHVLQALSLQNYRVRGDEFRTIQRKIDEVVDNQVWCMAALNTLTELAEASQLRYALEIELDFNRNTMFQLLSFIYDPDSIKLIKDNLDLGGDEERGYALEIMDVLIPIKMKTRLLPLLDDLSYSQKIRRLDYDFPQQRLDPQQRLKEIINRDYTRVSAWTKASALQALSRHVQNSGKVPPDILANLFNPDALLRETAAWGSHAINPDLFAKYLKNLPDTDCQKLERIFETEITAARPGEYPLLMIDRVCKLKTVRLLRDLPELVLARLIGYMDEFEAPAGTRIIAKGEMSKDVFVITKGRVRVHNEQTTFIYLGDWELVGEMAVLNAEPRNASVTAENDVTVFRFNGERFFELVVDYIEKTKEVVQLLNRYLQQK